MRTRSESYLWRLYLFKFFTGLHFFSGVLVPFFTQWGGLNFTQIMILQSWFMFWIFVFEIPTGSIADHFGRKFSLVMSCVISIIAALTYASVPNFYVFLLAEFLWALGATLFSGAYEALVYDTLKYLGKTKESKKVFGRSASFGLLGMMVSAPAGSVIAGVLGLRAPMLLMSLPLSIALLISLTFREPRVSRAHHRGRGFASEARKCARRLKEGVTFFCRNRVLRILAADMISIRSVAYFMIWLYQPMLQQAGVPIHYFGAVHAVFVLTQIAIMNHYEVLERVLGSKKRLLSFSSLITGAMFILGGITTFIPLVLLAIFLGGGFGLSRKPLFVSYMNKYIPSSKRATVLSTVAMLNSIILMLVNPVVGMLVDISLSNTLILLGSAAILFSIISRVEEHHLID